MFSSVRKAGIVLSLGFCIFAPYTPQAIPSAHGAKVSAKDIHEILEVCIYAQRIVKDYALIGMGVDYNNPQEDLANGIKIIEKDLKDIESHNLIDFLNDEVHALDDQWHSILPLVESEPSKENLHKLVEQVEEFTYSCGKVALDLAKDAEKAGAQHDVVLIGLLSMEVQRLTAVYMAKAYGAINGSYFDKVDEITKEYDQFYDELMAADQQYVPVVVKERLAAAKPRFDVLRFMANSKSGRLVPSMAEKTATDVFEEMQEILKLEQGLVE